MNRLGYARGLLKVTNEFQDSLAEEFAYMEEELWADWDSDVDGVYPLRVEVDGPE